MNCLTIDVPAKPEQIFILFEPVPCTQPASKTVQHVQETATKCSKCKRDFTSDINFRMHFCWRPWVRRTIPVYVREESPRYRYHLVHNCVCGLHVIDHKQAVAKKMLLCSRCKAKHRK